MSRLNRPCLHGSMMVGYGDVNILSPLSVGLIFAWKPTEAQTFGRNLVRGGKPSLSTSVTSASIEPSEMGMAQRRTAQSGSWNDIPWNTNNETPHFQKPLTTSSIFRLTSTPGSNNYLFETNVASGGSSTIYTYVRTLGTQGTVGYKGPLGFFDLTFNYTFVNNTWYRITTVYDQELLSVWVNGTLVSTGRGWVGPVNTDATSMRIGGGTINVNSPSSISLIGDVADVFVWDRALTDAEVLEHYMFPYQMFGTPFSSGGDYGLFGSPGSSIACRWSLMGVGQR